MYSWDGMVKIDFEAARKYLSLSPAEVYLLYDEDGSESLVITERQLDEHEDHGGGFGVHKEDYEKYIMEIVDFKTAFKYFSLSDVKVYMLYSEDNSVSIVTTERDMEECEEKGGVFGVHKEDYETVLYIV